MTVWYNDRKKEIRCFYYEEDVGEYLAVVWTSYTWFGDYYITAGALENLGWFEIGKF